MKYTIFYKIFNPFIEKIEENFFFIPLSFLEIDETANDADEFSFLQPNNLSAAIIGFKLLDKEY
jgi:hypothetical protein